MITVQVMFKVKKGKNEAFEEITNYNAENSRREEGVRRFEFYRIADSDNSYMLFECYEAKEDQESHRNTLHFKKWKAAVSDLTDGPYEIIRLDPV